MYIMGQLILSHFFQIKFKKAEPMSLYISVQEVLRNIMYVHAVLY